MADDRLFELNPTSRFSGRGEAYALARPSYPAAAIAKIFESAAAAPRVLDLGCGTGISTRLLAPYGSTVIGLDPNADMLNAARRDGLSLVQAQAEKIPSEDGAFDIVTIFNAFHWMRPEVALPEMRRVLKDEGRLAVVWNDWDARHPFTGETMAVIDSFAVDHPRSDLEREAAPLFETPHFDSFTRYDFENIHRLDLALLILRLKSMSYLPTTGAEGARVEDAVRALHAAHADADGFVEHHYVTAVFIGRACC